jgi:type IV pilus assembly protein PilV
MNPPGPFRPSARQSGIGMLEVLIAILVVSIGFLGTAALQARALSTNNSAMARSMATVASYSILDGLRSDAASAMSQSYNQTVTANACPTDTSTLVHTQLAEWCAALGKALGATASTTGQILCSNTGICTVTITFDDSRAGADGNAGGTTPQLTTVTTVTQL